MNKLELLHKIKDLQGLSNDEKAILINLVNTNKKYGLVWEEKPEDVEEELLTKLPVLIEDKDKFIEAKPQPKKKDLFEGNKTALKPPNHILIEGDNLHALTALTFTHEGKIDVIYIDPPYNTGNKDFKYNDRFVDKEDSYRHSKWLSFMSKRLKLAKRLLTETGVIFISIDDNEMAQLKMLCDEIFSEIFSRNIINTRRQDKNLSNQFLDKGLQSLSVGCEYIMLYSKTKDVELRPVYREASEDRQTNGYWKGFWNAADRPTMRYDILGFKPNDGQWKWKETTALEAMENYEKFLLQNKKRGISIEEYWHETGKEKKFIRRNINNTKGRNKGVEHWIPPSEGILRSSNWSDILTTQTFLDVGVNFSSPKNLELIKTVVEFSNLRDDITVLDFFAGSGTTLHATMQLNSEDGGNRQCILVTNNENNIAEEVCYERNKRVIKGYKKPNGENVNGLTNNNFRYFKTSFVGREKTTKNKKELTQLATELLCIKEDSYNEIKVPKNIRLFQEDKKRLMVIYDDIAIPKAIDVISKFPKDSNTKVYVFSEGQDPYTEDFIEVADKVELCALPDAIYKAFQHVLPKKSRKGVPHIEEIIPIAENGSPQLTMDIKN